MDQYILDRGLEVEVFVADEEDIPSNGGNGAAPNKGARPLEGHLQGMNEELKKLNKQMMQIVELKKQANVMAGAFYVCIIAIFVMFLRRLDQ